MIVYIGPKKSCSQIWAKQQAAQAHCERHEQHYTTY